MNKERKINLSVAISLLAAFVLWTVLVKFVDVQAIGPNNSSVGFASLNGWFHELTGENMMLYDITDWLGLLPILTAGCFGILGLCQLIKRKSLLKVDRSIIALGIFYVAVIGAFIFFEICVINYRPLLIEGKLEASYPSSTTMLVMSVMPTAAMQLYERIKNKNLRIVAIIVIVLFTAFMVIARILSGVHWITDIIGGAIISYALVLIYYWIFLKNS